MQRDDRCVELALSTYYGNLAVYERQGQLYLSLPSHSSDDEKPITRELALLLFNEIGERKLLEPEYPGSEKYYLAYRLELLK